MARQIETQAAPVQEGRIEAVLAYQWRSVIMLSRRRVFRLYACRQTDGRNHMPKKAFTVCVVRVSTGRDGIEEHSGFSGFSL
jgi:hypothetical protein